MNGCIALLLLGSAGYAFVWLWRADIPTGFRTMGLIAIPLIALSGVVLLARKPQPTTPSDKPKPKDKPVSPIALLVLAMGIGTATWVWLDAESLFGDATNWRNITLWAVALITLAGINRLSRIPPPKSKEPDLALLKELLEKAKKSPP